MVDAEISQHCELRAGKDPARRPPIEGRVFPQGASLYLHNRKDTDGRMPVSAVYPVTEDIRFLREYKLMTFKQKEYYLTENIIAFIEEFAGKIPLKRVPGLVLADQLQIGGFDMLVAGRRAVEIRQNAGIDNKREQAELDGLHKIHQALQNESVKGVAWVSASKVADYLMCFGFDVGEYDSALGGRPVSEYIYRKDERLGSVDVSKGLHQRLARLAGTSPPADIITAEDMLRDPIPFHGSFTIESVSSISGITNNQLRYSQDYSRNARVLLSPLIKDYVTLVNSYNLLEIDNPVHIHLKIQFQREAQPLIEKMYSVGVHLKRRMEGKLPNIETDNLIAYTETLPPEMITGGSQCPSWISGTKITDVMSVLVESGIGITEATSIMMGLSKDNIVYVNGVKHLLCECPKVGCSSHHPKRKVLAPIVHDRITCPCCHASAPYKC